ncbi:hypothetical protein HZ994_08150 [Akkermansiaceae bacterium]|nr:hypothetical protein HZ994_08150 [Akkermansiaceae bacterium]
MKHKPTAALLAAIALACGSCIPVSNSTYIMGTTAAANDHIMFVRQAPPTFGFRRLAALSIRHPDLAAFTRIHGMPDFLAETNKGDNRYLILYYLGPRKAFACRTDSGKSSRVEFSGPYPVTESEYKTLAGLR